MYLIVQPKESELDQVERLGLAYIRLGNYEWDEIVGAKPLGFEDLPRMTKRNPLTGKRKPCRADYVRPAKLAIKSIIGEANISRVWWKYGLGRTEEEWFRWYCSPDRWSANEMV